jgi:hypothetical protein
VDCPAAKAVVTEALDGSSIPLDIVDLKSINPDFEYKLLENQVFISSTPSIITENDGSLKLLYSGTVPDIEDFRDKIGVN